MPVDISKLPFNRLIGLKYEERNGRICIVIDPLNHHANHVGTVHATAIYGAAEAASGQCLVEEFPDLAGSGFIVLRTSTVKFRRAASLDSPLVALGAIENDDAAKFRSQYASRRRAAINVSVVVSQADVEILTGTFSWFAAVSEP